VIDGLTIIENDQADPSVPLTIFNDYGRAIRWMSLTEELPPEDAPRPFMPVPPVSVEVKNIRTEREVQLCEKPALMPDTKFTRE